MSLRIYFRQILYIVYFPPEQKYVTVTSPVDGRVIPTKAKTSAWSISIILSWVVLIHM